MRSNVLKVVELNSYSIYSAPLSFGQVRDVPKEANGPKINVRSTTLCLGICPSPLQFHLQLLHGVTGRA